MTASALSCFVVGCTGNVVLTRSWNMGPTLHACAEHVAMLPAKPERGSGLPYPGQQVLL